MSISLSSDKSQKGSAESVLRKTFAIVGTSASLAFVLSELLFFYFLDGGLIRYPENILVVTFVLSASFILIARYLSLVTAVLTFYVSIITIIFIIDWFFGSSADPSILHDYFGASSPGGQGVVNDFSLIGLAGGGIWMIFLSASQSAIGKLRKMSIRDVRFPLHSSISRVSGFFDKHPWFVTILMSVITLVIGIIIGGLGR